jgi:hypothetical protein
MRRLLKMVIIMKPGLPKQVIKSAITSQLGNRKAWTTQTGDGNEVITRQSGMHNDPK